MVRIEKLTEANCNSVLNKLYKRRDLLSFYYDTLIMTGKDTSDIDIQYNQIVDDINEICAWRRWNNCLLEGDDGYEDDINLNDIIYNEEMEVV